MNREKIELVDYPQQFRKKVCTVYVNDTKYLIITKNISKKLKLFYFFIFKY